MNDLDLEREIRAAFRRRGADVLDPAAVPPVREVLRQTRRQQATTILRVAAVVVAIVAASVAGVGALMRADDRRVPTEPPPDTFAAGPLEAVPVDSYSIESLTATADGALWWTDQGLARFDPNSGETRTFTLADDPAFRSVGPIARAREGGVWMLSGSDEPSVRRFDGEAFREDLGPGPVCALAEAPDGTLWGSGCEGGVFRWDGASWGAVPSADDATLGGGPIGVDPSGRVWVANVRYGTEDSPVYRGVSSLDGTAWTTWTTSDGAPSNLGEPIVPGPSGEVWIGTEDGIARFLDGSWVEYSGEETGIPDVWSVAVTDGSVLIAGYRGDQARFALFDGSAWAPVTARNGLGTIDSHPSVAADDRGVLWAATHDGGLFRFDGSEWQEVLRSRPAPDLGQIAAASYGELWATSGTSIGREGYDGWNGDVWRLEGGTWTSFAKGDDLPSGRVAQVAVAPDGVPWASTEHGLARFDGEAWEEVASGPHGAIAFAPDSTVWTASGWTIEPLGGTALAGSVPLDDHVTSLAVGPGGEVWASCANVTGPEARTLAHFDGEGWETVLMPEGASWPLDLEVTSEGDVWVSAGVETEEGQRELTVFRHRDDTWTEFGRTDTGGRLGTAMSGWGFSGGGGLETSADGRLLLLSDDALYVLRDGSWHAVVDGPFDLGLSVAPDGTVWLAAWEGLFRLPAP